MQAIEVAVGGSGCEVTSIGQAISIAITGSASGQFAGIDQAVPIAVDGGITQFATVGNAAQIAVDGEPVGNLTGVTDAIEVAIGAAGAVVEVDTVGLSAGVADIGVELTVAIEVAERQ